MVGEGTAEDEEGRKIPTSVEGIPVLPILPNTEVSEDGRFPSLLLLFSNQVYPGFLCPFH